MPSRRFIQRLLLNVHLFLEAAFLPFYPAVVIVSSQHVKSCRKQQNDFCKEYSKPVLIALLRFPEKGVMLGAVEHRAGTGWADGCLALGCPALGPADLMSLWPRLLPASLLQPLFECVCYTSACLRVTFVISAFSRCPVQSKERYSTPQILREETTLLGLHDSCPALSGMLTPAPENCKDQKEIREKVSRNKSEE